MKSVLYFICTVLIALAILLPAMLPDRIIYIKKELEYDPFWHTYIQFAMSFLLIFFVIGVYASFSFLFRDLESDDEAN